jgi:hypothetical protein
MKGHSEVREAVSKVVEATEEMGSSFIVPSAIGGVSESRAHRRGTLQIGGYAYGAYFADDGDPHLATRNKDN